jgi:hypothetical protein
MTTGGPIGWSELLARTTLANAIETFNITNTLPAAGIEGILVKVDGLQAGATDSADSALVNKVDTVRVFGNTIKSEQTFGDAVRMAHRIWGMNPLHVIGEADNEGLAAHCLIPLNPIVDGSGNFDYNAPYGAGPGQISQIQIVTAANQAATDTAFLTVYAITNLAKTGVMEYLQYKRKLRTAVAGAIEYDPISDMDTFCGNFQFLTTGVKDAAGEIPAGLGVRGLSLAIGGNQVGTQVASDALLQGGIDRLLDSAVATNVTVANYDSLWWDWGIRNGGRPLGTNWAIRNEEGVAEARRSYMIGLGR